MNGYNKKIGETGEKRAALHLILKGYRITDRNYRIRNGEIDIIAENGDILAFVEVKSRKPGSMVSGFEAVNRRKQGLIIKTAAEYCCRHPNALQPRFDTAQVVIAGDRVVSIDYIQNAYDTTGYNFIF